MAQKNQLLNIKNKDEDTEKTAFERFEQELKQNIFGILFLVLKDEESTFWKLIIFMIVSEIQFLSVIFSKVINYPWKNDSFIDYFKACFHVFLISYWCSIINWTAYLVVFYSVIGILFIIVLNIIYASYIFSSKQLTVMWPFNILRAICNLSVTILFYPAIDLFSSILKCKDENGELRHYMYTDVTCWKGIHIFHAIAGILAFIIYVVICLVIALCFFESKLSSPDPSARANSRNEFWALLFKTLCNIMAVFFIGDDYRWINVIVFGVGGVVLYIRQKSERPYYNEIINTIGDVNNGLFIWSTFMLVVVMAAEDTSFNGGIQAFLMGAPLIVIFLITKSDHRKDMLLKGIENYDNGDQWYVKVRYYISFIQKKEMNRDTSVELKGYIYSHEEKCTIQNCPLRVYVTNVSNSVKDNKRKKQSKAATENFALLMRFANALFLQGIGKFPTCTSLRIAYAFFLKDRMNNRTLAINELLSVEKHHPPFDEQFLIFRYRKLIEDEMADVQTDNQSGALDAISMIAYDNYLRQFKEAVERSACLHMEFWLEVLELEPDLGKLDKTGSKIHLSIVVVEDYWGKLQKINSNTPKALKMYAEFLIEVLNDSEAGGELLSRAKDTAIARTTFNANSLDAAEIMGMGDMCAGMGGADGTPCVIASGEQGKIGEMVQFNMAVCRAFGYTKMELNGRKVSSLMPDMYAKVHDKILQRCINNSEDVISRSEIFVLGRHKSGYLMPLFLQTRILTSVTQGILFAATLNPEKKGLNACYLLLNEQQDVIGISSRCISTLKLSNKLLKNSRVSFQTLAPSIQDKSMISQYNPPNTGAILEFFLPDVNLEENDQANRLAKDDVSMIETQHIDSPAKKLRVRASKDSLNLSCIINNVVLLNEAVGYLVRLDVPEDGKDFSYEKKIDRVHKFPNIQFAFDPINMRFIQEDCEEDAQKLMADETFIHVNIMRDRSYSGISPQKSDENRSPDVSVLSGVDEVTRLQQMLEARSCGEGIKTKQLVNGEERYIEAKPRLLEKKMEEEQDQEEAKRRDASGDEKKEDIFQSSLKSKKAFNAALNEKSVPPSIKRLKLTGYAIALVILTLISVEFGLLITELKDINDNIHMIKYSRERIAIQMKMVYYINKIILLYKDTDPKITTSYDTPPDDMINSLKDVIGKSLNNYYDTQGKITLSKLSLSDRNEELYSTKCVTLYYRSINNERISKTYTLTEAIQQLASEVFTVNSFVNRDANFKAQNDDLDFILYNSFADLYLNMERSANYFVDELKDRGSSKKIMVYILYAVGLAASIASVIFLFPVVASVSKTRLDVLSLFLDIPQNSVRVLEKKTEKFVAKSSNEAVDDAMSNEGEILTANGLVLEGLEAESGRTGRHKRKFKNNTTSNTTFYLQFILAMLIVAGYFSFNFAYGYIFLSSVSKYSRELNATTGIHTEIATSFSVYQNLLGHRQIMMYTQNETFEYLAFNKIPLMYTIASEVQNSHNDNQNSFKKDYQDTFIDIMRNNLCDLKNVFDFTFDPCDTFLDGTIVEGLHPVIIHYIEQLREMLTSYHSYWSQEINDPTNTTGFYMNGTLTKEFLSNESGIDDIETTIFEVIELSVQYLVNSLVDSYTSQYDTEITKRIILFICFIIVFIIAFLALWIPFTNRLNDEVKFE